MSKHKIYCTNINCNYYNPLLGHYLGGLCNTCKDIIKNNKCEVHVCEECGDYYDILINNNLLESTYIFDKVCDWCFELKYSHKPYKKKHFYNFTNPFIKEPKYAN